MNIDETVCDNEIKISGHLLPNEILNNDILFNGEYFKYINFFLVEGEIKNKVLEVKNWKLITPFSDKTRNNLYDLNECYFRYIPTTFLTR